MKTLKPAIRSHANSRVFDLERRALAAESELAQVRTDLTKLAAMVVQRLDHSQSRIKALEDQASNLKMLIADKSDSIGFKMGSLEKQMREMRDIHLEQNRAALREVLARLELIVPSDQEVSSRLLKIANSARASYDAIGKPYPPQLQSLLDYLAKRGGDAAA